MSIAKAFNKKSLLQLKNNLKYSLHCIVSPFDGFWDLTHENRGSTGAATIIIIMTLLTSIWKLKYSSFIFYDRREPISQINMIIEVMSLLLPLSIWCISNWGLTTLFEGKGTLKQIYMATGYALTPYVLIQIPLIIFSNFVTVDEGAFYNYFSNFAVIWAAVLMLVAIMMIHDFGLGKALVSIFGTILGMLVMIFLLVLFFSLISDSIAYFVSIIKEIEFRFY